MPPRKDPSQNIIDRINEGIESRRLARRAQDLARADNAQLPLWPEAVRGLPNPLARSALFTVANRVKPRADFKNRAIASINGVRITYRGEELRQDDEDVFLQILHIGRRHPLGEAVQFTAHAILSALGWGRSVRDYHRLKECLSRLNASALTVATEDEGRGFSGSLVRKFAWRNDDGSPSPSWRVWLEPELVRLFAHDMYTQLYWDQRLRLSSPLAKWLHTYYYTHATPFPHKVDTLKHLCGSSARTSMFRRTLREALNHLKRIGFLRDWRIDSSDTVHVLRAPKPSPAQALAA